MGLNHSPRIVTTGLVFYWDAENIKSYSGTGSTFTDLNGRGNQTGYNIDETNFTSTTPKCFDFNGTDERFRLASELVTFGGTFDFTWEAWINPSNIVGDKSAVSRRASKDDFLGLQGSHVYVSRAQYAGGVSGGSVTQNVWSQIAGSGDSLNLYVYLNGEQVNSVGHTTAFTGSFLDWYIGCLHDWSAPPITKGFVGKIACVRVYNQTLTTANIMQNYLALKGRYGL